MSSSKIKLMAIAKSLNDTGPDLILVRVGYPTIWRPVLKMLRKHALCRLFV